MKILKLAVILFIINFAIFAIGDAVHVNDFVLYLFILPVSITVSVILLIITAIRNARNKYIAKDAVQRKHSRKRGLIIFGCVVAALIVGYIVFMFACGYKIPGRDKHKNWPYFPGSSNPEMVLASIPNLYIYNIEPLPNTAYYIVHFTRDSLQFHDSNLGGMQNFGIVDSKGNFKVEYIKSTTEFMDGDRIIVKENTYGDEKLPVTCDFIDSKTLAKTEGVITKIPLPATKEEFDEHYGTDEGQTSFKQKYQSAFFKNLSGVKSIEADNNYDGSDYRGYSLYKDESGKLYQTTSYDDGMQLDMLSPQVSGYTPPKKTNDSKSKTPNIQQSGESIILYNDVNSGMGGSYSVFYEYHQTWLLYYSATIGKNTTSFKLEGSDKDHAYTTFYQLNKATADRDTLVFFADGKLYRLYKK